MSKRERLYCLENGREHNKWPKYGQRFRGLPMSNAHTPGPWELIGTAIEHHQRGELATVIAYLEDEHTDEWTANARLIAKAPEMVEALRDMVCKPCETHNGVPHPWCDRARTLLWEIEGDT